MTMETLGRTANELGVSFVTFWHIVQCVDKTFAIEQIAVAVPIDDKTSVTCYRSSVKYALARAKRSLLECTTHLLIGG
jgi:hypothetical protein